ncbi:hypothetical protein EPI10_004930 [Gossypium australe]|uniref:Uncharacterized protein n=1 Tax=Gossypium australe TaxID=47621 RepID=A0A5B6WNA7_9ROSI|nr:hypothetical protein EPI10_004930 [Gossypium australe]
MGNISPFEARWVFKGKKMPGRMGAKTRTSHILPKSSLLTSSPLPAHLSLIGVLWLSPALSSTPLQA